MENAERDQGVAARLVSMGKLISRCTHGREGEVSDQSGLCVT